MKYEQLSYQDQIIKTKLKAEQIRSRMYFFWEGIILVIGLSHNSLTYFETSPSQKEYCIKNLNLYISLSFKTILAVCIIYSFFLPKSTIKRGICDFFSATVIITLWCFPLLLFIYFRTKASCLLVPRLSSL